MRVEGRGVYLRGQMVVEVRRAVREELVTVNTTLVTPSSRLESRLMDLESFVEVTRPPWYPFSSRT